MFGRGLATRQQSQRAGHGRAGQGRAGHGRAAQGRAAQEVRNCALVRSIQHCSKAASGRMHSRFDWVVVKAHGAAFTAHRTQTKHPTPGSRATTEARLKHSKPAPMRKYMARK